MGIRRSCLAVGFLCLFLFGCSPVQQDSNLESADQQNQIDDGNGITPFPSPSPIPTFSPTATVVPLPTLDIDSNTEAIEHLFISNNGCEYPCWWGITPGETSWLAAFGFLEPLAVEIESFEHLWYLKDGAEEHKIVLEVPEWLDPDGLGSITVIEDWWGIVQSISVATNFTALGLDIRGFLQRYGAPGDIFIYSQGSDVDFLEAGSGFTIVLFYPDSALLVAYFGISDKVSQSDRLIKVCFSGIVEEFAWLNLWDPSRQLEFEEIATPGLNSGGELKFEPIGEISGLTPETFSERAVENPQRDYCFEITNPGFDD